MLLTTQTGQRLSRQLGDGLGLERRHRGLEVVQRLVFVLVFELELTNLGSFGVVFLNGGVEIVGAQHQRRNGKQVLRVQRGRRW